MPRKSTKTTDKNGKKIGKDDDKMFYIDPAEELRKRGIYYITDEIETDSLIDIHQDIILKHLDPQWTDDIQIVINSVGGSCAEAWAIVDLLDWIRMDVKTTAIGECCSMGALLTACGTRGKRLASPNSIIMIHDPWISHVKGNVHELADIDKVMKDEQARHTRFWIKHSNCTTEGEVEKLMLNNRDNYMTPEEAVKYGIIDGIVGQEKPKVKGGKK